MERIISDNEINVLTNHKDKPLLNGYRLCYITDFEIKESEIIKKSLFGKEKITKVKLLTKYTVKFFHSVEKQIYFGHNESALKWLPISTVEYYPDGNNILHCRQNYLSVKETIEGFGHKLISDFELKKEKENDNSTVNTVS